MLIYIIFSFVIESSSYWLI